MLQSGSDIVDFSGREAQSGGLSPSRAPRGHNPLHATLPPVLPAARRAPPATTSPARQRSAPSKSPGEDFAQALREQLREKNRSLLKKPRRTRSSPVWLPKKNPLSERTIQRVKTLMDAYTIHGQVTWSAYEEIALKLGNRPDAGTYMLFGKFSNESTGTVDIPTALRLLFPHIDHRDLNTVHRQIQNQSTGETVKESSDWRDKYDPDELEDLINLFSLYSQQAVSPKDSPKDSPRDAPPSPVSGPQNTFGAHCRPPAPALPNLSKSKSPVTAHGHPKGSHSKGGPAEHSGPPVNAEFAGGFTKAQVRACFAPDTVPDDWIEEVFRGVEGGRLGLEAFAIMMEQALSRRSEPLGDLKLYFQP